MRCLVAWIFLNSQRVYKSVKPLTPEQVLQKWVKIRERGQELFNSPPQSQRLKFTGDCDDFTTFAIYHARRSGIKNWKIGFIYNPDNQGVIHVFPIISNKIYDPWQSKNRRPYPFRKKENMVIIENQIITDNGDFIKL